MPRVYRSCSRCRFFEFKEVSPGRKRAWCKVKDKPIDYAQEALTCPYWAPLQVHNTQLRLDRFITREEDLTL